MLDSRMATSLMCLFCTTFCGQIQGQEESMARRFHTIPEEAPALTSLEGIVPGTPLLLDTDLGWHDVAYVGANNRSLQVVSLQGDRLLGKAPFSIELFAIRDCVKSTLSENSVADVFVRNLGSKKSTVEFPATGDLSELRTVKNSRRLKLKNYPVGGLKPLNTSFVREGQLVEEGSILAAYWANRWFAVRVLADDEGGPIPVQWYDFQSSGWDCEIARNQLIALNAEVGNEQSGASEPALFSAIRTWRDDTGVFSLEAKATRCTETTVTLTTKSGQEFTVQLSSLDKKDQEYLRDAIALQNPFQEIPPR